MNKPLHVAVIGMGRGWHTQELQRALQTRGHRCTLLPVSGMRATIGPQLQLVQHGVDLGACDAILVRILPRSSLEQVVFRMDALHLLQAQGVRVINSAQTIERTVDKLYTTGLLAQAGLPTPRTVVCERSDDALAAFAALGGDVVLKPVFGSLGLGIVRIESEDIAYRVFKALELERAVYYLQETIDHGGCDRRAFVLGGRVLAAMERVAGGWRTNIARGAVARPVQLTLAQEELCLRAAELVGATYAGVDLLRGPQGDDYLIEINGIPGWQGIQATTQIDIAGEIVAQMEQVCHG